MRNPDGGSVKCYRLIHMAPAIQVNGGVIVEPTDIAIPLRHLHMVAQAFRLTDKPVLGPVTSAEQAEDVIAMAEIVFGDEFVRSHPVYTGLINSNSPRVWDETKLDALKTYARAGQAVLVQQFSMMGASIPANFVAATVLACAEALVAIALMQFIRPGTTAINHTGDDDRDGAEEALAIIPDIEPGGDFLGTAHTLAHYPYQPELQDYNTFEQWDEESRGNTDELGRRHAIGMLDAC